MKNHLPALLICMHVVCCASAQVPGLTTVFKPRKNCAAIKWHHTDKRVVQYELQRRESDLSWLPVYIANPTGSRYNKMIKYTDRKICKGKSYYRLKVTRENRSVSTSAPITVIIGERGKSWLMYPVPAKDVLHLQYNGHKKIPGVITVYVRGMRGQVFKNLRLASTTRLISIPIDNLGRGIYDVQIIVGNRSVFRDRFVK